MLEIFCLEESCIEKTDKSSVSNSWGQYWVNWPKIMRRSSLLHRQLTFQNRKTRETNFELAARAYWRKLVYQTETCQKRFDNFQLNVKVRGQKPISNWSDWGSFHWEDGIFERKANSTFTHCFLCSQTSSIRSKLPEYIIRLKFVGWTTWATFENEFPRSFQCPWCLSGSRQRSYFKEIEWLRRNKPFWHQTTLQITRQRHQSGTLKAFKKCCGWM